MGYPRPFPSIKKPPAATPDPPWAPLLKFTIICGCCTPTLVSPIAPSAASPSFSRAWIRMVDSILGLGEGKRILVMGPVVRGRKREHAKVFEDLRKAGYVRVMVDGNVDELTADFALEKNKKHTISAVVDRLVIREDVRGRLGDSIETAMELSGRIGDHSG